MNATWTYDGVVASASPFQSPYTQEYFTSWWKSDIWWSDVSDRCGFMFALDEHQPWILSPVFAASQRDEGDLFMASMERRNAHSDP